MTANIQPRIGMRVILTNARLGHAHRNKSMPPQFAGVICRYYVSHPGQVDVQFVDHFGQTDVCRGVTLRQDDPMDKPVFCTPAPGEPEHAQDGDSVTLGPITLTLGHPGGGGVGPALANTGHMAAQPQPETIPTWSNRVGKNTVLDWAKLPEAEHTLAPLASCALKTDLAGVLNMHSAENGSNTPDFVLAHFLLGVLDAFDEAVQARDAWHKGARPAKQPPAMARTTDAPRWDLSLIGTNTLLDELRARAPHYVSEPGEDLGCVREQAQAWEAVCSALDEAAPDWRINLGTNLEKAVATIKTLGQKRALTAEQANSLACAQYSKANAGSSLAKAAPWVINAIIAASRGEGRQNG